MNPTCDLYDLSRSEKVVVQFGSRVLKGHLELSEQNTIEEQLTSLGENGPGSIRIRRPESEVVDEVHGRDIKAIFFVNSFEGNPDHKHLNFSSHARVANGVWIRMKFRDNEVMEGIISNSLHYLIAPGFFVLPTDPGSNNKLVYVMKDWLVDHRVLGLRKMPEIAK